MRSSCWEVSNQHAGSKSSQNWIFHSNQELGSWGRLWQGWLRSWALLQASNPPAKESQLSWSSSHTHPAPGMRPAGSNKKKSRQEWEVVPEVTIAFQQMKSRYRRDFSEACGQDLPEHPCQVHREGIKPHVTQKVEAFITEKAARKPPHPTSDPRGAHADVLGELLRKGHECSFWFSSGPRGPGSSKNLPMTGSLGFLFSFK